MVKNNTTLCITAGGRPDLLKRTLGSLLPYNKIHFSAIIVCNDNGDSSTNEVARLFGGDVEIINHASRVGHMESIDEMYSKVKTDYIFHCEDDWFFDPVSFVPQTLNILSSDPKISAVAVRQSACYWRHRRDPKGDPISEIELQASEMSNHFTLNPSLLRKNLWRQIGPYSAIGSEGNLDQVVGKLGLHLAYLRPGVAYHIGGGRHVETNKPPLARRIVRRIKRMIG